MAAPAVEHCGRRRWICLPNCAGKLLIDTSAPFWRNGCISASLSIQETVPFAAQQWPLLLADDAQLGSDEGDLHSLPPCCEDSWLPDIHGIRSPCPSGHWGRCSVYIHRGHTDRDQDRLHTPTYSGSSFIQRSLQTSLLAVSPPPRQHWCVIRKREIEDQCSDRFADLDMKSLTLTDNFSHIFLGRVRFYVDCHDYNEE